MDTRVSLAAGPNVVISLFVFPFFFFLDSHQRHGVHHQSMISALQRLLIWVSCQSSVVLIQTYIDDGWWSESISESGAVLISASVKL
jgi:hypothetical protein